MHLSSNILIGEEQLERRLDVMASAIAADTPEEGRLSVLAVMDGAFMFCAGLVRRLPMPVHLAFVPLISVARGGDPKNARLPDGFPVRGADLLVVEDILDTGRTLSILKSRLTELSPRRIRLAVLLDKPVRRAAKIQADYTGFTVDDRWVVGYGLDSEGLYRNLPYISYMERG
ncbi:MAG: hypoxanthine phosphoribosyltransferase [bacterium]|nr:hypoxanthine phosphoribosyltransferase [bacterium]